MLEFLLPAIAPSTRKRRGSDRIKYTERKVGDGLSGAERQKAYQKRFIGKYGREAWRKLKAREATAAEIKAEAIITKNRQRHTSYKEAFIAEHGEEAWKARKAQASREYKERFIKEHGEQAWRDRHNAKQRARRAKEE